MKIKVLADVKVEADLDGRTWRPKDMAAYAEQLESAVREFQDFVRDHRSMDWVKLSVIREYEDQCSHCGYRWELDSDGIPVCCHKAIDEAENVFSAMGMDTPKIPSIVSHAELKQAGKEAV